MKVFKISAVILFLGLLLQVYAYLNLQVSYKYEVDLMETNIHTDESLSISEKAKRMQEVKEKEQDIFFQKKVVQWLFVVFLISLIIVVYFLFGRK